MITVRLRFVSIDISIEVAIRTQDRIFLTDDVLLSYQVLYCISLQSKQMAKKRHNKRSNQLKKGCGPMEWNISIIIETNNKIVHKIVWMIDSIFESIFSPQYLMGKEC